MKTRTVSIIDVDEWDKLVTETYGKPYNLQQQGGCMDRGIFTLTVPDEAADYQNDFIPEIVNHEKMGVSFAAWLARDPNQPLCAEEKCRTEKWAIDLWWERNFYPELQTVANDLNAKGLLPSGNYTLNIDW